MFFGVHAGVYVLRLDKAIFGNHFRQHMSCCLPAVSAMVSNFLLIDAMAARNVIISFQEFVPVDVAVFGWMVFWCFCGFLLVWLDRGRASYCLWQSASTGTRMPGSRLDDDVALLFLLVLVSCR